MTELEKYELINKAESFEELEEAILKIADNQGYIMGRQRQFLATEQAKNLIYVAAGYPANILTRSYGIRQQALYLDYYNKLHKLDNNRVILNIKNTENER